MTIKEKRKAPDRKAEIHLPLVDSLGYLLREVHKMQSRVLQAELAKSGIAFGSWYYLRVLWEEDGLDQHALSKRVDLNDATTRTAVDRMEADGLVTRQAHPVDRRRSCVFLTKRASDLRYKLMPIAVELNEVLVADFTVAERRQLMSLLTRAKASYERRFFAGKNKAKKPATPAM